MNCCINCFENQYIKTIIRGKNNIGNCDFCGAQNINIYKASKLDFYFTDILDLFVTDENGDRSIGKQITSDYFDHKIFAQELIAKNKVELLISEIIKYYTCDYQHLLDNPVKLKFQDEEEEKQSLTLSWDKFSEEIKSKNRFHLENELDLDRLRELFQFFQKKIDKKEIYYRARISDKKGYDKKEMWNPPNELAKSGRANPNGISYLYLAKDLETTLYEVRASLFDYVSVSKFELKQDIKVINLSHSTYDIFELIGAEKIQALEDVIKYDTFINKLEQELSKPRRRSDSELDYLPTQYLSELIKSMGFDGIEFKSSLHQNGVNLVIFDKPKNKFEILDVSVYDITEIMLDCERIENK
ncbi:RES domain-containing protein [Bergeyella cardium]|uniref:RES domain-containing protein n=1 Tax=Bergeyella cardium TaxID=1585976 RepID=A0A6P1QW57_9FLAO|nr:RES domain-containing protein [Bergeyella cardium]QHN65000.1 RES domain-containing protein [Bergeyella cardium]WHE34314.1 RES domain-containing protein [Bergeyella cardium]WHF60965.1 RES domain-containing protein [Bergeyella cardium]